MLTSNTVCQDGEKIQPNCSTRCICRQGQFRCQQQPCNATCICYGDPHYRTFDSRSYSFQGDCEYILTEPCNTSEFSVIVKNSKCSTRNPHVTCTERVTVLVPNDNITIELGRRKNGGTVTINGTLQPNSVDGIIMKSSRVTVQRSGGHPYVLFPTYGVQIFWNGRRRVKVTVSRMWEDKLCGLCGNFNDHRNDDFKMPNGSLAMTETAFGDSWQFNETTLICNQTLSPPNCTVDNRTEAESICNVINQTMFASCNDVLDPTEYIEACIFDYCFDNTSRDDTGDSPSFCDSLANYATDCLSVGAHPPNETSPSVCRKCIINMYVYTFSIYVDECLHQMINFLTDPRCPSGKEFQQCGPLCPQTCNSSIACNSSGCAEGCFCPDGQAENSDGLCIDPRNCPSKKFE